MREFFNRSPRLKLKARRLPPGKVLFEKAGVCQDGYQESLARCAHNHGAPADFEIVDATSVGLEWINQDGGKLNLRPDGYFCVIVNENTTPATTPAPKPGVVIVNAFALVQKPEGKIWIQHRAGEGMMTDAAKLEQHLAAFWEKEF